MLVFRHIIFYCLSFIITVDLQAQSTTLHPFTVYAYIPWPNTTSDILSTFGIKPIKVVYELRFLTQGNIDQLKIKQLAEETIIEPDIPISFDIELGNRFKPETVIPIIQTILVAYHSYKPKALVGIYATVPQNTYGLNVTNYSYDKLNAKYASLSEHVDFISPSLYNYNGHDIQSWFKSAQYNMREAKKYASNKPIIPYISPIYRLGSSNDVKNGTIVEELDEKAMQKRLQMLYDLGAAGCIIWVSSQDRKENGQILQFAHDSGWGKAVVEFIKTHPDQYA
jgi:hypothetical protein